MHARRMRYLGLLAALPLAAAPGPAHAAEASPPPGHSDRSPTIVINGITGNVEQVARDVSAADDVVVQVRASGEAHFRYRIEAKSEDEPDPRRFEVGTLSGGPPGGGDKSETTAPEEANPAGSSPACDCILEYVKSAAEKLSISPSALLELASACEGLRAADGRLQLVVRHRDVIRRGLADTPPGAPGNKGAEQLAQELDQNARPRQKDLDRAMAAYRLFLRVARILKPEAASKPADLKVSVTNAAKGLFKAPAAEPGAPAKKEEKPVVTDAQLATLADDLVREAAGSEEAWRREVDIGVGKVLVDLQHLLSAIALARDRVVGDDIQRSLGRFPSGKRITVTVYRSSPFSLEAPPVDSVQGLAPQAESVLATASFHVYHRVSLAISVGAGAAFMSRHSQDFGIIQDGAGHKYVGRTRDDAVVPDMFLLLSWNPFSSSQGESARLTGPWLSTGASLISPQKSWMPVGLSCEYSNAVMFTVGYYLAKTNRLDPAAKLSVGNRVDPSVTAVPTVTRWTGGVVLVLSFDPPVLKSLVSK